MTGKSFCISIISSIFLFVTYPLSAVEAEGVTGTGYIFSYTEDGGQILTAEDVISGGIKWTGLRNNYINFGYTDSAYWFRISGKQFINSNTDSYVEINNPQLDRIDFLIPSASGYSHIITGDSFPFSRRQVADRCFVFRITSDAAGRDVYFRVQSKTSLKFRLLLYTSDEFINRLNRDIALLWMFYGMMFLLLAYSVLLYFGSRDRTTLYFVLFLLFLILINLSSNGFTSRYLWPEAVYWNNMNMTVYITFIIFFVCLYILSFVDAKRNFPVLNRFLIASVLCIAPVFTVLSFLIGLQRYYLVVLTAWVLFSMLAMSVLILKGLLARNRPSRYLLLGFAFYFSGIILYALKDHNLLPYNVFTEWSMHAGSAAMVLLFATAFMYRVNALKDELLESEKKFRLYLEKSPVSVFLMGREGGIRYVNPALTELTGYDEKTLLSFTILNLICADQREKAAKYVKDLEKNDLMKNEFLIRDRKGENIHVIFDSARINPDLYIVSGTNITYRHQIEDELRAQKNELQATMEELEATNEEYEAQNEALISAYDELERNEKRFREMIDRAPYPIAIMDKSKKNLSYNRKFAELAGYEGEDNISLDYFWEKTFLNDDARKMAQKKWAEIENILSEKKTEIDPFEWEIVSIDGDVKTIVMSVVNMTDSYFIMITDITERKRTQEIMIQSEKMISLGGLAAGMAHEINNPLGIVLQGVQVILNRISPDLENNIVTARDEGTDIVCINRYLERRKVIEYLHGISEAGNRAAGIISNMLNFSRRSASQKEEVDINVLVDNAIRMASNDYDLKKKYDFKTIRITRDYGPDMPPVCCVMNEIEQVLLNLLKNSAQAMIGKTGDDYKPEIVITTRAEGPYAVITVDDNGPGMTREVLRHIFDPFYTTKSPGVGTGLGLSVSYFIITSNHKGMIDVDSTPGKGTVFTIRIPFRD